MSFWENDPIAQPAGGGAPQPIFTVPDPVGDEKRAGEADRLRLAKESSARAAQSFENEQTDRRARGGVETTEGEKTAAFLATRVANGIRALSAIEGGEKPELDAEAARYVFGDTAANLFTSGSRQRVEAAQLDILDAALTLGTGAAYTAEQLRGYQRSYFPQIGDNEATVLDKRQRLNALLASARVKAGAAAPKIDEALAAMGIEPGGQPVAEPNGFDRNRAVSEIYGMSPEQERMAVAYWNSQRGNAGLTVEGARSFYQESGLPAPDESFLSKAVEAAKGGASFGGLDTTQVRDEWQARVAAEAARQEGLDGQSGALDLANHGVTAGLSDEARGAGLAIGRALTGDFNFAENYRLGNAAQDLRLEQARDRTGATGTVMEVLGNAASLGSAALTTIPTSRAAAVGEGALAGSIPGFGYGEGTGESVAGAALGATAGGLLGRLFYKGKPTAPPDGPRVMQAADDLNRDLGTNIVPLPADVGGAKTRRLTAGIAQSNFGATPIINAANAVNAEGAAAKNAIAAKVGTPDELEAAGNAALSGSTDWMKRTRTKVNALYTKARSLSDGVAVPLTNARRVLDEHIAELEATPGGIDGVNKLRALRDEIGEDYTVDAIKRMRTTLRERFIGDGLRKSDIERRVGQVVDAAEQDVADGLTAAGKGEAAEAWSAAAAAARDRLQTIDNVLAPIIGKKGDAPRSGEEIMRSVAKLAKGNNARLAKFLRTLPTDDAATVRATVISRLGTTDADAANFTLGQFASQWEKMPSASKRTLFGGELTEALDKLATVAGGAREAMRYANHSNTGSSTWTLANMGGAVAGIAPGIAMVAGQAGLGRLLASPRFARWLARMPKDPAAAQQHVRDLSKIAAAETAIATDALSLQSQLAAAFQGGSARVQPVPLAAQEPTSPNSQETGAPR